MQINPLKYYYIATADTFAITDIPCTLVSITVNTTANGTIKVIDGISTDTDANVATLKANVVEKTYEYNVALKTGLVIITGAASNITVCYTE